MVKNLVIVESPAKAKTIEKYLGKDFMVKSSMGHIRDLKKGDDAVDIEHGFEPKYEISSDKKSLVTELKKLSKDAEVVWLATDEDREGEAISWHLFEVLGLNENKTKRIVFNEITKPAILKAIEKPRTIDKGLVDAQQARRVLDRLVGYELSPVLWRKVKPSLSAGRVQSVAVRLIVEREREINDFTSKSDFKITAEFNTASGKLVKAELPHRFAKKEDALAFLQSCIGSEFKVLSIETKPSSRNPAPPFTTSTLQQEAARKLGFSVSMTMQVAQRLYENGYITYMRTDSVNLSKLAIDAAQKEVISLFGERYSQPRNFTTKNENAQEAHEAIRPTYFENVNAGDDAQQKKLYDLIWKRTIASQMAKAELERTIVEIGVSKSNYQFRAEGEVIKFDGFLKVYTESHDEEEEEEGEPLLPRMDVGEKLEPKNIKGTQKFSKPAPRYTEASLVKKLEELGIGRPSTYAPTISTIQKREYVIKESRDGFKRDYEVLQIKGDTIESQVLQENFGAEKNKLFPTDIGTLVTDFLVDNFKEVLDYGFTASVEKEFDEIASGKMPWKKMIGGFYEPFHKSVEETTETAKRVTGERELGTDPKTGKPVIARMGRFGPLVQLGTKENGDTPQFASLQKGQSIETISLEDALKLFGLPREVFSLEGEPVIAGLGRFGPYLKHGAKYYNVPKGTDLMTLTPEDAELLIMEARKAPQFPIEIGSYEGEKLTVNKGRFGPYVKFKDLFVSIPRGEDALTLSQERAIELIKAKQETEKANILLTFPQESEMMVLKGRYGPYLSYKKKSIPIPKGTEVDQITFDMAMSWVENAELKESAGGKGSKVAASKKTASPKKATAKKTTKKK